MFNVNLSRTFATNLFFQVDVPRTSAAARQAYQNVDKQLEGQLIELLHALHDEQVFIAKVDPQSLGEMIWNNVNQMFTDFISDEEMSLESLKETLNRQMAAIMALALK